MSMFEPATTIEKGQKYMIELPEHNVVLHIICINKAIYACGMRIVYMEKNNESVNDYVNHFISYRYEWNFKSMHYSSFDHLDKCFIYKIISV